MKKHIMIIDDEECLRDSFRMFLEGEGHRVETREAPPAGCPLERESCRPANGCPDALIIDQHLNGCKGIDYLERLQRRSCRDTIARKVLLSASLSESDRHRALSLGCDVASKPWTFAQLEAWLTG